ncbi:MAG: DUF6457 domain-containing protein [Actinomycetota bacterium]
MAEWIDGLAEALGEEPLNSTETTRLLKSSREVAHRVERKFTPLSTFLLGIAVARKEGEGRTRPDAIADVLATLQELLPDASPDVPKDS